MYTNKSRRKFTVFLIHTLEATTTTIRTCINNNDDNNDDNNDNAKGDMPSFFEKHFFDELAYTNTLNIR
uniref:Uncharacterized protein n=1 Tax=Glossina brevipalpis TaxID=37001 RepID=A0A1A9WFL6_9MUSC